MHQQSSDVAGKTSPGRAAEAAGAWGWLSLPGLVDGGPALRRAERIVLRGNVVHPRCRQTRTESMNPTTD